MNQAVLAYLIYLVISMFRPQFQNQFDTSTIYYVVLLITNLFTGACMYVSMEFAIKSLPLYAFYHF